MKPTYFLICTLLSVTIQAQDFSEKILQKMGDEDLLTLFNEIDSDSIKAEKVARVYLNRARKEKDTIKMARGYEKLARIFNPQKNILFADSIIYLTKNMDNITYPALGYMIKGYEYSGMGNLVLANKNDIIVYELAVKNENIAHQLFITDKLIGAKSFWGNKREALEMQKKRHDLVNSKDYYKGLRASVREGAQIDFKDIYLENEISSIRNFVVCYINLKVLDSATMYLNKGLKKLYKYKGYKSFRDYNIEWFIVTSAEIDFYKGNFNKSLDTINKLLLSRNNTNNDSWVLKELYYFKGLMLINLGKNNEGIENLKKADSIFVENNILFKPYHREMYVKLLEHYTVKNDVNKKVKYLNKLIYVDSIFIRNYQFFEPDMIRNFETPKLIKEKEKLIASLKQENKKSSVATLSILGALGISLFGLWYFFRKQQIYKKRFTVLMSQNSNKVINGERKRSSTEIPKNIINDILEHLALFEVQKQYLSQEISLQVMAASFNTNYKYLSKVINLYKEKRFPNYINDLRVVYAFTELKTNKKFRKYTIKAIAKECGFKSAESFSKCFYNKYRIYPSFYLKQLDKSTF